MLSGLNVSPERGRTQVAEMEIEFPAVTGERGRKTLRKIDLIDIAGGDVFKNQVDGRLVFGIAEIGLQSGR